MGNKAVQQELLTPLCVGPSEGRLQPWVVHPVAGGLDIAID